jgi:hypothetical protein
VPGTDIPMEMEEEDELVVYHPMVWSSFAPRTWNMMSQRNNFGGWKSLMTAVENSPFLLGSLGEDNLGWFLVADYLGTLQTVEERLPFQKNRLL